MTKGRQKVDYMSTKGRALHASTREKGPKGDPTRGLCAEEGGLGQQGRCFDGELAHVDGRKTKTPTLDLPLFSDAIRQSFLANAIREKRQMT